MKIIIDVENMLFEPFRRTIRIAKDYRHRYGESHKATIFYNGKTEAYRDICNGLNLLDKYNEWAYEHRDEVKDNAQT